MLVSEDSKPLGYAYLIAALVSLGCGIALLSTGEHIGRYVASGGCFTLFVTFLLRFLGRFVKPLGEWTGLIIHIGMHLFVFSCLGILGYIYGSPYDFFLGVSILFLCYGLVIGFFKENHWKDGQITKNWWTIRKIGIVLMLVLLVIGASILLYKESFLVTEEFIFIPAGLGTCFYLLAPVRGTGYGVRDRLLSYLVPILLGLCPIVFLFL